MKTRTTAFAAVVAVVAAAGLAHADTLSVKYLGTGKGSNVRITTPAGSSNVFAGQLRHELTGGTGLGSLFNGTYVTYCSDVDQFVTSTTRTYSVVPLPAVPGTSPMGADKANALTNLYSFAGGSQLLSTATNDFATAFQLAVWEIVHDFNPGTGLASLNITAGSFRAQKTNSTPLASGITTHLSSLFSAAVTTPEGPAVELAGITHATAQDQIVLVPTPGALALAGVGGLLLAKRRRSA
jgi:hypothetical protein